jgi:hypothetical protein
MAMKRFGFFRVLRFVAMVIVASVLFGLVIEHLWNWLMPAIFSLRPITFAEAVGLFVLSKLLFGGFHRHGGGRRGWKGNRGWGNMKERWEQMTPEQQERFRSGMRGGRGWACNPAREPSPEGSAR